jgi:hypothetical protein
VDTISTESYIASNREFKKNTRTLTKQTHPACSQMQQTEVVILKLTLQYAPKPCHSFSTSPKLGVRKPRPAAYVRPSTHSPPKHDSRKTTKTNVFSVKVNSGIIAHRQLFWSIFMMNFIYFLAHLNSLHKPTAG